MNSSSATDFSRVCQSLREILAAHPAGLSEYQLLKRLAKDLPLFQGDRSDPVILFRQHFILFHCLYRLQQTLFEASQGRLEISTLRICLQPGAEPDHRQQLDSPDPLRAYYLDLSHLQQTGQAEVDALLQGFWAMLGRHDGRSEALRVLGLTDPVGNDEIRRRYRELVMRHHPDRGGDTRRLQLLNAAIATLLPGKT